MLALTVATFILAGVFSIANGGLTLANRVSEEGAEVITHEAFLTFMSRNFEQLPGNARLDLTLEDGGSHYLSDMTFQNVPTAFSWAGQPISAEAVRLSTVPRRTGGLDIVLRYYDVPIIAGSDPDVNENAEPVAEIVLLRDVYRFEWFAIDRDMEESDTWDVAGRLPRQLRLNVVFSANGEAIEHYFWIPPKMNPESVMNSLVQKARNPVQQQPGGPANSDDPTNPNRRTTPTNPDDPNNRRNSDRPSTPNVDGNRRPPIPGGGTRATRTPPTPGRSAPPIPGR